MSDMICVVTSANEAYAMPLCVTLHSALDHLDPTREAQFYILDAGILPQTRNHCVEILEQAHPRAKIHWITPDTSQFEGLNAGRYSIATFLRLMIPELVDSSCARVLYVDSDVIVNDDLSQLWDLEQGSEAFWAVANPDLTHFHDRIGSKFDGIDAPTDAPYFNSGVLLINIEAWKKHQISQRTLVFLQEHSAKLSFADQDALNAMAVGLWKQLDPRWNDQVHRMWGSGGPPGITHYTSAKPWRGTYTGPRKITFFKAYLRSRWDSPLRAYSWAGLTLAQQITRHNIKRIKRRWQRLIKPRS